MLYVVNSLVVSCDSADSDFNAITTPLKLGILDTISSQAIILDILPTAGLLIEFNMHSSF